MLSTFDVENELNKASLNRVEAVGQLSDLKLDGCLLSKREAKSESSLQLVNNCSSGTEDALDCIVHCVGYWRWRNAASRGWLDSELLPAIIPTV